MYAGAAAAAAAGASGASGLWLFSYNKDNFGYDAGMRFGRFMMSRGFANAQVGQYREDIQGITGMTVTKMDAWQSVTTLFLAVGAALSCAGRIGMHGSAPPGWYCALFSGSIFMSVMFNGISLWLSMHASLRAQCASVSLLTRKVRLPIPSMDQIDQARVFASAYEKQEYRDIFRVPFMRHPHESPDMPFYEDTDPSKKRKKQQGGKAAAKEPHQFGSTTRDTVPSWIRDEVVVDKAGGHPGGLQGQLHDDSEVPDHFRLLAKAQEEYRDYDVYARITMLYGVISFLYAVTYYAVGYAICELRGFWAMWSLPAVFLTAQALILRLDILKTGNQRLPNAEFFGHLAPYFAVAACTLEYRYYYSQSQVAVTWGLVFAAYLGHFLMALRMLDLAWPVQSVQEMPEEPGKQWWPVSWKVPSGFTKHLWFITPPKKLPEGQSCLLHEMDDMAGNGGGVVTQGERKATIPKVLDFGEGGGSAFPGISFKRANDLPWRLTRVAIVTAAFQWFFMMIASGVEIVMGPETLLKPPGEPPWIRDTKYRTWTPGTVHLSSSGALPEGYRLFAASQARYPAEKETAGAHGAAHGSAGGHHAAPAAGHHRRLSSGPDAAVEDLLEAVPLLTQLAAKAAAAAGSGSSTGPLAPTPPTSQLGPPGVPSEFMAPAPKAHDIAWPPLFEPTHLACAPPAAAAAPARPLAVAITRRGFGAMVRVTAAVDTGVEAPAARAEPFALDGLDRSGPISGASWTPRGLVVVTAFGEMLRCGGHGPDAASGVWQCSVEDGRRLPVPEGSELLAAALSEPPADAAADGPLVAVVFKHLPEVVGLFRAAADGASWHHAGEVHVPPGGSSGGLHLGFAPGGEELLVTTGVGEVMRRRLSADRAAATAVLPPPATAAGVAREHRGACATARGDLLRLALRRADGGSVWSPELLTMP